MATTWTGFYTATEAARLARVPRRTFSSWQKRGFAVPSLETNEGSHGYSYADVTILRLLRAIREQHVDFRSAGIAFRHLYDRLGPPSAGWEQAIVEIRGREVFVYIADDWDVTEATRGGQQVETRLFSEAFSELADELAVGEGESFLVPPQFRDAVTIDPTIRGGEPVVRGTRIPTALLAVLANTGNTARRIARMYGTLTEKTTQIVLDYERYLDGQSSTTRAPAT